MLSMPNPETNTRLAITEYILARPCPGGANAAPQFAKAWRDLERLLDLLGHHQQWPRTTLRPSTPQPFPRIKST